MGKYSVPARNRKGTRTGYTTGSNASAAAKAATVALLTGEWPSQITITLPIGETATMTPVECELGEANPNPSHAACYMVKDAGDDPDVTHGALIGASVRQSEKSGIHLEGGKGVGRVTLPGLGLEVGGPAINPVPRQQITENVLDAVREFAQGGEDYLEQQGLEVIVTVPEGETLAKKTLNARLGILGGISILGTTGKVFPYSTAAWRASVIQAVEVAAKNHTGKVVMATGGRSERHAMSIFPELPKVAFVELSIFTGDALKTCVEHGVRSAVFVGMMGKMVKTAQGHMTTHVAGNQVDFEFLAQVCRDTHAPEQLVNAVANANTGRHFLELCQEHGYMLPVQRIVELALQSCQRFVQEQENRVGTYPKMQMTESSRKGSVQTSSSSNLPGPFLEDGEHITPSMALEVILIDFDGNMLGRASSTPMPILPSGKATSPTLPLIQRLAADPAHSYDDEESSR